MAPSRVNDADYLDKWRRMEAKRRSVGVAKAEFRFGVHARISKVNMSIISVPKYLGVN